MAKRVVVATWVIVVLALAGLLFDIHLAVLAVPLLVFEFAMVVAIAVWRPDRKRAGTTAPAAGRPRLGTPLDPIVRTPRRERRREQRREQRRGGADASGPATVER